MSYRYPDTGDPELDKKLAAEDYDMLFHNLAEAVSEPPGDDDMRFWVWLDKLALIDEDRVLAYMVSIWDSLSVGRRANGATRQRPRLAGMQVLPAGAFLSALPPSGVRAGCASPRRGM